MSLFCLFRSDKFAKCFICNSQSCVELLSLISFIQKYFVRGETRKQMMERNVSQTGYNINKGMACKFLMRLFCKYLSKIVLKIFHDYFMSLWLGCIILIEIYPFYLVSVIVFFMFFVFKVDILNFDFLFILTFQIHMGL